MPVRPKRTERIEYVGEPTDVVEVPGKRSPGMRHPSGQAKEIKWHFSACF
jgi:hypothetical protein